MTPKLLLNSRAHTGPCRIYSVRICRCTCAPANH